MTAKVFSGKDGQLLVGDVPIGKVVDWSFEGQNETLETTTLGDYERLYICGLKGYSGSATLLYYKDDGGSFNVKPLLTAAIEGKNVDFKLRLADITNREISFTALITSYGTGVSVGEVVRMQFSFTATGKTTFSLAPT